MSAPTVATTSRSANGDRRARPVLRPPGTIDPADQVAAIIVELPPTVFALVRAYRTWRGTRSDASLLSLLRRFRCWHIEAGRHDPPLFALGRVPDRKRRSVERIKSLIGPLHGVAGDACRHYQNYRRGSKVLNYQPCGDAAGLNAAKHRRQPDKSEQRAEPKRRAQTIEPTTEKRKSFDSPLREDRKGLTYTSQNVGFLP